MIFSLIFYLNTLLSVSGVSSENPHCISPDEKILYDLIMDHRQSLGLKPVPMSTSLSEVARLHSIDLMNNFDLDKMDECNLHSWSKSTKWNGCCYTADHSQANCMWDKPKEINGYPSHGYEISYFYSSGAKPEIAMAGWEKSPAHISVIANRGIWSDIQWKAIGIGIHGSYATVWFGTVDDENGVPKTCRN